MTVRELIAILKTCPKDAIVIMSKDSEGNRYKELSEVQGSNTTWDPEEEEAGYRELNDDVKKLGFGEDGLVEGQTAIILWPVD